MADGRTGPGVSTAPPRTATGVEATARITAAAPGSPGDPTRLPLLSSAGPLALRRTRSEGPEARVTLVGAMSAPLGGDRLALRVRAEPGARLCVDSAAATLALPGPGGEPARYDLHLSIGDDARVRWLPEPLISAQGSVLHQSVRIDLAPRARLVFRDVLVLGRTGEEPGRLTSRLTLVHAGRPLLDQRLDQGSGAPGWDSAAVLGGFRAVGQLLVAGPQFTDRPAQAVSLCPTASVTPLAGPAALVTAVAPDALLVGRVLDDAGRFTT